MAGKDGGRQRKQAAKAVRRRQVVAAKQQAERAASSLPVRIAAAAAGPVERCLRTAKMDEAGIGHVVVARWLPSGALGCAFFLIDLFCLGAKDAFYRELPPSEFEAHLERLGEAGQTTLPIDPASAKAAVKGAVAFAAACGLAPAKDYSAVVRILDGVDEAAAAEHFTFGRDGKPLFVPGPRDSMARIREVERALTRALGDGWDIDPILGMDTAERLALRGMVDLLGGQMADDGLLIEHEGPTNTDDDGVDDATALGDPPPSAS